MAPLSRLPGTWYPRHTAHRTGVIWLAQERLGVMAVVVEGRVDEAVVGGQPRKLVPPVQVDAVRVEERPVLPESCQVDEARAGATRQGGGGHGGVVEHRGGADSTGADSTGAGGRTRQRRLTCRNSMSMFMGMMSGNTSKGVLRTNWSTYSSAMTAKGLAAVHEEHSRASV